MSVRVLEQRKGKQSGTKYLLLSVSLKTGPILMSKVSGSFVTWMMVAQMNQFPQEVNPATICTKMTCGRCCEDAQTGVVSCVNVTQYVWHKTIRSHLQSLITEETFSSNRA